MAKSPELIIKILGNSYPFKREMAEVENQASLSMSKIGKAAIAGGAVAAIASLSVAAKASVEEFRAFEKDFSNVVTLLDSGSFKVKSLKDGIEGLKEGVIDLRAETGESFENLNKGLFDLVSAGVSADDAINALRVSTNLALAGATETSVAVDGMTSALGAYGLEASSAQAVAEKFFTAQKFGKTTIEELSNGFGQVGGTAASLNVSLDEVLASVSAVTLAGVRTSESFTGLKAVLTNIIKPSQDTNEEAKILGVEFNSTALRAKGLAGFLDEITSSERFTTTSLERLFGSAEAVNFVMALAGNQASDFEGILKSLGDETERTKTFQDGLAAKTDTVDFKFNLLKASVSALATKIGEDLSPSFGTLAENAAHSIDSIRNNLDAFENSVVGVIQKIEELNRSYFDFIGKALGQENPFAENLQGIDPTKSLEDSLRGQQIDPFSSILESAKMNSEAGAELVSAANEEIVRSEQGKAAELSRISEEKRIADEKTAEQVSERKENDAARDAEREAERIIREEEQFQVDLERLNERLLEIDGLESKFKGLAELREIDVLKKKARTAQQKQDLDKQTALAGQKYTEIQVRSSIDGLSQILGTTTTVGKAVFLLQKALAIADIIQTTQRASMLAYASQLIPGDPTSIARAQAAKISTIIQGAVSVGIVAATALQGVQGAAEGGIVQGGVFGKDTEPFMLARDEIIVPSKLNPLSPNFDQTFGGGLLGGGGNVKVEIGFEENASKFLTVKQREDRALGIQR